MLDITISHSLAIWTQPRAIKCKVIHNKPFFFSLLFPLRECLINSSYGQQSILWDCFPLERYTAFFYETGWIKMVQGKFRVMTLNINVLVFPDADLYISHTWSVATDVDIQPVELLQTSLLVSLFVFFFSFESSSHVLSWLLAEHLENCKHCFQSSALKRIVALLCS